MTAIESLREELNRHRAYIRGTRINVKNGVNEKRTIQALAIREHDFVILRNTIRKIKKIRPKYYWQFIELKRMREL